MTPGFVVRALARSFAVCLRRTAVVRPAAARCSPGGMFSAAMQRRAAGWEEQREDVVGVAARESAAGPASGTETAAPREEGGGAADEGACAVVALARPKDADKAKALLERCADVADVRVLAGNEAEDEDTDADARACEDWCLENGCEYVRVHVV